VITQAELDYLGSQRVVRLATVDATRQPTVDAVGFQFDGTRFFIGGHNLPGTRKYRNVAAGNHQVALLIEDLVSTDSWTSRGIKIHDMEEIVERDAPTASTAQGRGLAASAVPRFAALLRHATPGARRAGPRRTRRCSGAVR
jgi:PPOX class F420-dependent enzyme/OxyR family protein